jgi:hypothetical protein
VDIFGDGILHGDGYTSPTNPQWIYSGLIPTSGNCNKLRDGRTEEHWLSHLHYGFNVYRAYWMPPQPVFNTWDFNTLCQNWDIYTLRENGCGGCITHYLQYFPNEGGWRYVAIEDYGYGKLEEPSFDVDIFRILIIIAYFVAFSMGFYVGQRIFWY